MPYVKQDLRSDLSPESGVDPDNPGELNYQFTKLINFYVEANGLTYTTINDVIGALKAAKLEFYRRIVVPYEERKIVENGDVY